GLGRAGSFLRSRGAAGGRLLASALPRRRRLSAATSPYPNHGLELSEKRGVRLAPVVRRDVATPHPARDGPRTPRLGDGVHHLLVRAIVARAEEEIRVGVTIEEVPDGAALGDVLVPHLDHAVTAQHPVGAALEQVLQAREELLRLERPVLRIGAAVVPGDGRLLHLDGAAGGAPG